MISKKIITNPIIINYSKNGYISRGIINCINKKDIKSINKSIRLMKNNEIK